MSFTFHDGADGLRLPLEEPGGVGEMKTIWKFPIQLVDRQLVSMPIGAKILAAQFQHHQLCVWALVEPTLDLGQRLIVIVGTGHPVPLLPLEFIGTVQANDGALIWHVFAEQ